MIATYGLFTMYADKTNRQHPYTVLRVERITFYLYRIELKAKANPSGHHSEAVWVRFAFQLDSLEKSDPPSAENLVERKPSRG